jgi:hypothetical protein
MNTKRHLTQDDWNAIREEHANFTPEEARAWIRSVMGPPRRTLEGQERENVWLMILMQEEPDEFSNNQHSITEVYKINQREYHVHYFSQEEPVIEEILEDD